MAVAGLVTVGLAVSATILLVVSVVAPGVPTVVITAVTVCSFAGLWFALPLARRGSRRSQPADRARPAATTQVTGPGQPPSPG
jgi:hypothetical protein